ncbi:hypothetical protein Tco_0905989, partial [Tanacetum coccineum]
WDSSSAESAVSKPVSETRSSFSMDLRPESESHSEPERVTDLKDLTNLISDSVSYGLSGIY